MSTTAVQRLRAIIVARELVLKDNQDLLASLKKAGCHGWKLGKSSVQLGDMVSREAPAIPQEEIRKAASAISKLLPINRLMSTTRQDRHTYVFTNGKMHIKMDVNFKPFMITDEGVFHKGTQWLPVGADVYYTTDPWK